MNINIRTDVLKAQKFFTNLRKDAVLMAAARAINDTTTTLRAEGARMIKQDHPALKIGDIKGHMTVKRAHKYNLRGVVGTQGAPLSALLFRPTGGRVTKKGTTPVSIMFGKQRGVVSVGGKKGFRIAKYGNEVFVRTGQGRGVRRFRGPSLPGVFRAQAPSMVRLAQARWSKTFASRMQYEIERAKR